MWKKELLKWVLKKLELILCQNGMKLNKNRNLKWPYYAPSICRPPGKARVYKCTIAPWHRSLRQAAKQPKPTAARPVAATQQVNKQPGHTQTDVAGHNRIRTGNPDWPGVRLNRYRDTHQQPSWPAVSRGWACASGKWSWVNTVDQVIEKHR